MLLLAGVLLILLLKCLVSIHDYSGFSKPPMHGDFEAQRHWMEITVHLPVEQWYKNSSVNDLQYWGLDYPPLTAYHSYLCGKLCEWIDPSWVTLNSSRGIETLQHKLFMRSTVLVADLFLLIPAVLLYFHLCLEPKFKNYRAGSAILCLMFPGLILIDNGHFQYNNVSLGLALLAVTALYLGQEVWASVVFVLALNYKQMELYHAMPFFCYLLGKSCRGEQSWLRNVVKLGLAVIVTFALVWLPFLSSSGTALQVVHRIFPVARGVFEDKVANVWCSLSVVFKWKKLFDQATMVKICLATTVLFLLPSSANLLLKPTFKKFHLALVNSSLVFFLFSFQVHEKSILLAALPVSLFFPEDLFMTRWFLQISTFSMLPLLVKDGLFAPFVSLMAVFHIYSEYVIKAEPQLVESVPGVFKSLYLVSAVLAGVLSLSLVAVPPPQLYPDLWPLLICVYSCAHFTAFLVYYHQWQIADVCDQSTSRRHIKTT